MEPALSNMGLGIQRLEKNVHMLGNDGWMTSALVERIRRRLRWDASAELQGNESFNMGKSEVACA